MINDYESTMISIVIYFQFIFIFLLMCSFVSSILLIVNNALLVFKYEWYLFIGNIKFILIYILCFVSLLNLFIICYLYLSVYNKEFDILTTVYHRQLFVFLFTESLVFSINDLALVIFMLTGLLYPVILILMQYDFSGKYYRYFSLMIWLYFIIYIFIFSADIIIFYLAYELIICLVFCIMYYTSSSRGSIEAVLFFLGWAIIGSFCLGIAVIYIVVVGRVRYFDIIFYTCFSANERYFLYWLIFFGFGTKLSIWPFWYWLPRAHVEVSTGMSIFLSCILIKICFFGLIKMYMIVGGEVLILPFLFCAGMGVFDLTSRLLIQVDLKAITAYSSVLHINLFIILFLLDTNILNSGLVLYIWGHSYATAGMFFSINLIERCCGTRLTFELSGVYNSNPIVGLITLTAVIGFLEFPLSFFFWGELWLWILILESFPLLVILLMLFSVLCYIIIFFRLWWCVLFGGPVHFTVKPFNNLIIDDIFIAVYLISFQYIVGIQPNILCWYSLS